jgi:ribonucleoside-diphosphate reductase alpha chain
MTSKSDSPVAALTNPDAWGALAETVRLSKYAHTKSDGTKESWEETAKRVPKHVFGVVDWVSLSEHSELQRRVSRAISNREFLPGGRYLYGAGREYHQVQNCLGLRAEDTREGWGGSSFQGHARTDDRGGNRG